MTTNIQRSDTGGSLLTLLHPRGQERLFAGALAVGALAGWLATSRLQVPLWGALAGATALLALPAARKWRADLRELGASATALGVLLATQSLHTVEHVAQWAQYYLLGWPLKAASGLISPLNAEIVHFSWNTAVLGAVIYLLASGLRGRWMWLLLLWAGAHTAEHAYLFVNYLQEVQRLAAEGLPLGAAQGLPGFFGKGGWLAANAPAAEPVAFLCRIAPGLVSAPRLDVHFWWNVGEVALLLAAAHSAMRRRAA
jgi:hypothetical protein